jgi:hypothetical protein
MTKLLSAYSLLKTAACSPSDEISILPKLSS